MNVRFSVVSEFLDELEIDLDHIEDKIMRVSRLYQPVQDTPLVYLVVVAGCVIRGQIVELRQECGQMLAPLGGTDQSPTAAERLAERLQHTLKEEAVRLDLTIRAGILAA